jgi:frataxin-like iron-binding protein CyaY
MIFHEHLYAFYQLIESKLENVDPDLVECTLSSGTCTLLFQDGSRLILSGQSAVSQLWLAWAKDGVAVHYVHQGNYHWVDEKKQATPAIHFVEKVIYSMTGLTIKFLEGAEI